jgi:hypothetical protein
MRLTPERVRELLAVDGTRRMHGGVLMDAELVRDLAADLLDARAALDAHRTRAEAAEADRDYWREQATAAAPCVDEIRRLTLRVVRGGTGCALDPVLAVDTAIATLDGMMVSIERIASVRDAARAEADALRAIIAGRTVAPSDEEIEAHAAAGGSWLVRYRRDETTTTRVGWHPLDATGRPCAWPLSATGEPTTWPVTGGGA